MTFLVQDYMDLEDTLKWLDQATSKTIPWAAAFMAGTEAGHIGQHEGKPIDKA
jgi:hypothetical protein